MNNQTTKVKSKNKGAVVVLALALIVAIILSMYAYSKYTSTLTGNGTATVAKWSFKVNGQTQTIPDIDLATTMKENNNVVEGKLAPGTEGSFDLNLDATGSEVAIDYNIKLVVTEKPTNLRFYTDSSYTKEIASTDGVMNVSGVMSLEEIKTIQTKTIYWKWPYQTGDTDDVKKANDKIDTADSKKSVTMTITVTGTQRNPSQGEVTAIDELQVGDVINYNPSGTYSWDRNYATSNSTATATDTLSSSAGKSFNVSKWKVLSIDKSTGKIEMVPATVTLQGVQGYNNAVKLLNDASLIAKTDEKATNGYLKAASIQPYQTYYNTTVDYATTASLLEGYSNILLPKGSSTTYWVASRCVGLRSSTCDFNMHSVYSGYFSAVGLFYSDTGVSGDRRAVFPVVSLNSQLLEKATDGTYNVK